MIEPKVPLEAHPILEHPEPGKPITHPQPVKVVAHPEPVKPAAHVEPVKPATHPEPVQSATHGEPVKVVAHPEPVKTATHVEPTKPVTHSEPVQAATHVEPVKVVAHPEPVKAATHVEPTKPATHPEPVKTATHVEPVKATTAPAAAVVGPVKPDEIVASIAGAIAARAFNGGMKYPVITPAHIAKVLSGIGFSHSISAETMAQTHTFLAGKDAEVVISNARALAAHVLRARLTVVNREAAKASSGTLHPRPIGGPVKAPTQHPEPVEREIVPHPTKGGHALV